MSDTKNHKLAIKAIIEAHRTPGKMREIMLTILADKPSAIVNAWDEVNRQDVNPFDEEHFTCDKCFCVSTVLKFAGNGNYCPHCGLKQSESL